MPGATITVDEILNAEEVSEAVPVTIALEDGATFVSADIDGVALTEVGEGVYTFNAAGLADGTYTITVVTEDGEGNQSTTTQTITIDTAAPEAPTVALANDSGADDADQLTNNGALTVDAEDGATIEYLVDDGEWSAEYDPSSLEDGEHTVRVRVTDAAGNVSAESSITFILDTTAPADAVIDVDDVLNAEEVSEAVPVTITLEDGAILVSAEFNGVALTEVGEGVYTFNATGLEDGSYDIVVVTSDAAGNQTTTTQTITIDTAAPEAPTATVIDVDALLNAEEVNEAVSVTITPAAGTTIVSAKIGDTDLTVAEGGGYTFDASELDDGEYTITVVTEDGEGNQSTTTRTVIIDTVAPADAVIDVDAVLTAQEATDAVPVAITPDNGATIVSAKIGNTDLTVVEDGYTFDATVLDDGEYDIVVVTRDAAGNTKTTTKTIIIDAVNDYTPTDIRIIQGGGLVAETAEVGTEFATLTASDLDVTDTFTFTLVGENGEEIQDDFFEIVGNKIKLKAALNDAQVGLHELRVKVTDAAGHNFFKVITVGVYNTEEAPELEFAVENASVLEGVSGTIVGNLSATDEDGDEVTISLVDDAGGRFEIVDGKLKVKDGLKLDYEQAKSHTVTVQAKDSKGLITLQTITVNVANKVGENIVGTAASEAFFGGTGRDVINGGAGNDTLGGGLGNDVLTGGAGRDSFVFNTALNKSTNVDTIKDFSVRDDTIRLENAIFKKLTKTGTLKKDFFTIGTKAKDKNDYIVYNNKTGALYYDADGSGKGAAVKFAQLSKGLKMTAADFFVI